MIKVILTYLLIIAISILVGLNIVSNYTKSSLYKGTKLEEYKDGDDR